MARKTFEGWLGGEYSSPVDVPASDVALSVIDMQNAFLREEYSLGIAETQEPFAAALPGSVKLVEAARAAGVPVIYTRYAYLPGNEDQLDPAGRAEGTALSPRLVAGTVDIEIVDELAPIDGEIVLDKSRPSAFYGTRLEPYLTARGIRSVVICGVTTNICVETTARDASQRGYKTYVIEDAVGEAELSRHWHALYTIEFIFGTVATVEDVQRSWDVPVTGVPGYPLKRGANVEMLAWLEAAAS
ncbi:cysteine hydrolase family protein [Microbacterium murale]|uniref:Nicotinamidase-related amidase n=1 Tax=Microbacterium murale TaxID=1081040 RepID=A0ABU0P5U2_9MICO|nr:isochorismatase family cysteine hydrolase [Microbacterium murale]MDQ0642688.1 nicotinamidase-related amidase [Microbacterium murale]